jgi:hypothetical protein
MCELEKYMYIINNEEMTLEEKTDLIHDKWLNYEMLDETEEQLYELLNSNK